MLPRTGADFENFGYQQISKGGLRPTENGQKRSIESDIFISTHRATSLTSRHTAADRKLKQSFGALYSQHKNNTMI
jgi:hypothetical protein